LIDGFISRQDTGSTTASEASPKLHPNCLSKPLLSALADYNKSLPRSSLSVVQEKRGWIYFLRHVVPIPTAFVGGIAIGIFAAYLLLPWMLIRGWPPSQAILTRQEPYQLALPPVEVPRTYLTSKPLNNSCLIPRLSIPTTGKPQTFDACGFVIKSTDEVWNLRGDVDVAIEKYFHEDYVDAGSWGKRIIGKKDLKDAVLSQMRAFPDLQIHITDCVCRGNDIDGYKCAMPDILTGTNMGPSAYGPATGNKAKWTGLVQSFVKQNPKTGQWQYYAEWGVHDEWSLIQQLGLDFSRIPHAGANTEPLHDCFPLLDFSQGGARINKEDSAEQMLHDAELFH
jgi:hypothetical protein